ncbi:glucose/galactose MFS transporter [Granulicella cerasi]|uniref:Glucose/galactose MFS transporter n=1 Tax=Granulicella cerasi TaxID=741063 RepID=A0ABW1Z6T2_9BACT|nr:glucose/galactose MFS transporter [Granulicella cerasi]
MTAPAPSNSLSLRASVVLVTSLFFTWGFLVSLNDVLVSAFRQVFHLSYSESTAVQLTFYLTCFAVSYPASRMVSRLGYRHALTVSLAVMACATLVFARASSHASFQLFLAALSLMAAGIAALQTAASPYVSLLGDASNAPSRYSLALAVNSLGSMLAPSFGAWAILPRLTASHAGSAGFRTPYLAIGAGLFALVIVVAVARLPDLRPAQASRQDVSYRALFQQRRLLFGVGAMFFYVGAEIAIGGLLINYLCLGSTLGATREHAAFLASLYNGGAMIGRFVGFPLLRRANPQRILAVLATTATLCVLLSVSSTGVTAAALMLAVGLCNSLMVPILVTSALDGLGPLIDAGSGLFVAALVGGALLPSVQGHIADAAGLRFSFLLPALCYLPSIFFGLKYKGRPQPLAASGPVLEG